MSSLYVAELNICDHVKTIWCENLDHYNDMCHNEALVYMDYSIFVITYCNLIVYYNYYCYGWTLLNTTMAVKLSHDLQILFIDKLVSLVQLFVIIKKCRILHLRFAVYFFCFYSNIKMVFEWIFVLKMFL